MPYTQEDFHYVINTFGKQTVERMLNHRSEFEANQVRLRLDIRKRADKVRALGYTLSVSLGDTESIIVVRHRTLQGQFKLTGPESSFAVNEALLIRSGVMSDVIPLRLTDILLDRLNKPFVLQV